MSLFIIIVMCMLLYTVVSSLGSGQSRKTWKDIAEFSYHLLLTLCTRFEKLTMSIPSWFKVVTGKVVSLIFFMQKGFLLYWTLLGTGPESWVYFEMCKRGGGRSFFLCDTRVKLGRRRCSLFLASLMTGFPVHFTPGFLTQGNHKRFIFPLRCPE